MIVVDTSIAIKWINPGEEGGKLADLIYEKHMAMQEIIIVPQLFFIEAANALATKSISTKQDLEKGITLLYQSQFKIYETTSQTLHEAARLAKEYKTSVYDMLYAVIAKENGIVLVTADTKFVNKVNFPFVKSLEEYSKI